jgi:ABC-2 type transport system ATP-binding protein
MDPIRIDKLSKLYTGKRWRKVQALNDVSFNVKRGEIFGFLGPNGAGKSTTIKILMGMIRPTSGQTLLCGKPSNDSSARKNVGYLPENPALYDFLTGREFLAFVASSFRMTGQESSTAIASVLDRLDLSDAARRPIRGYSKGMVQRLALAQTLLHDPDIYVLDEPMSGLDPQGRALVKDIIVDLKERGKTVFFSTHITADVEKVCDRLAILAHGRLCDLSSVDDLRQAGVKGYKVVIQDCQVKALSSDVTVADVTEGYATFQVNSDDLVEFLESVKKNQGSIELVEPIRQDLEQYFLDVVNRDLK